MAPIPYKDCLIFEIYIKHIFYESFLIHHLTENSAHQHAKHRITMSSMQKHRNQNLMHVHTCADVHIM